MATDVDAARQRPPVPPGLALATAVLAVSWAGPLVRFTEAPALVVAAWRLIISVAFIAVVLVLRGERMPRLSRTDWLVATVSGVFLAGHFWSWIASLDLTTISSSAVLISLQPAFVALLSGMLLGEAAARRQWAGILVAVCGAVVIAWGDIGFGRDAILGDLLAVAGAFFGSVYYVAGRRLRATVDLWWYVGIIYGIAALVLAGAALATPGVALTGHGTQDWLVFIALAAGPMMLGHTAVNYALRYVRAYVANIAILGEPIGATLIAWLVPAIGETPGPQTLVGGLLILGGIMLTVTWRKRPAPVPLDTPVAPQVGPPGATQVGPPVARGGGTGPGSGGSDDRRKPEAVPDDHVQKAGDELD